MAFVDRTSLVGKKIVFSNARESDWGSFSRRKKKNFKEKSKIKGSGGEMIL